MSSTFGIDDIAKVVQTNLMPRLATNSIFTFKGPLGAGKTTMIKEFFAQLGISDVVTSPTFMYVKRYKTPDGRTLYHFDLYRLTTLDSFLEMGFDEYLHDPNGICVIEWPEVIGELLQDPTLSPRVCAITLDYVPGDLQKRSLVLRH